MLFKEQEYPCADSITFVLGCVVVFDGVRESFAEGSFGSIWTENNEDELERIY